jgi:hypothetical protein
MAKQECSDLATKVMKVHAVSEALTKGWHYLEPSRRAESLEKLKKRVNDLLEAKQVSSQTASEVLNRLNTLAVYNTTPIPEDERLPGLLVPAVVDMAVDAILDCGCAERKQIEPVAAKRKPTRSQVRIERWEERDRLHIGIQDKETGDYLADWWDDDARQMFEDGFFVAGKGQAAFENSVLEYAEDMGILAK